MLICVNGFGWVGIVTNLTKIVNNPDHIALDLELLQPVCAKSRATFIGRDSTLVVPADGDIAHKLTDVYDISNREWHLTVLPASAKRIWNTSRQTRINGELYNTTTNTPNVSNVTTGDLAAISAAIQELRSNRQRAHDFSRGSSHAQLTSVLEHFSKEK
jgi:hypothetical protein